MGKNYGVKICCYLYMTDFDREPDEYQVREHLQSLIARQELDAEDFVIDSIEEE